MIDLVQILCPKFHAVMEEDVSVVTLVMVATFITAELVSVREDTLGNIVK